MVSVQFGTYDKQGYHKSIVKTIGSGIIRKAKIGVHDYVGIGRNQLFISVEMGSVSTEILDFDGTNLRILYSGYPVRTHTRPYRTAKKHWQLEEITHTTRITKQDVSDGFRSMNKYTMVRSLRWNGERWAPVTRHGDYKD